MADRGSLPALSMSIIDVLAELQNDSDSVDSDLYSSESAESDREEQNETESQTVLPVCDGDRDNMTMCIRHDDF